MFSKDLLISTKTHFSEYKKKSNIVLFRKEEFNLNIDEIKYKIGQEYVEGSFEHEETEKVKQAFADINRVNQELFKLIPYRVIFTTDDVYQSAKEMREKVAATGEIYIFTEWSGHPYLTQDENNMGRAVHDVWAHMVCGCPFTFQGEYNAYLEQRKHYPESTWRVLFAEIPGQTAAYYFKGSFDYDQRAFEAPKEWLDLCEPFIKDYSENAILKSLL